MSQIPKEIMQHRTRGTEIKKVGKHYYIQRVKCVWDPQAKKRRKMVIGYIGSVTESGIQPKGKRIIRNCAVPYSKEFGATWVARELSCDIYKCLEQHFEHDAPFIYVVAILRCIHPCAMRYLEHHYETSWLSELFPDLDMRSETVSQNMKRLGAKRNAITTFMKDFVPSRDWFAIFDSTSMICNSKQIHEAQRGYNAHAHNAPQINLMYALALKDDNLAPVFYKRYPGSIRDVSAFRNMANDMGLTTALIIADKGFTKNSECKRFECDGLTYVMPLRRNSTEYSRTALQQPGHLGFTGRFKYNGRIIWFVEEKPTEDATHKYCLYLDESLHHAESSSLRIMDKIGRETPEALRTAAQKQLEYGTFALKTNLLDSTPERIYRAYKTREEIEQLFDMYKSEEQFATTGMHSAQTQEACLFFNHLSLMIAYRVYERLKKNNKLKEYAIQKTLEHLLKDIRATRFGSDKWQLEPVPKVARLALEAIGVCLPEAISTDSVYSPKS